MVMSFLYHRYWSMQANGVPHGEKWMSVGNNEMRKMISLYSILYCYGLSSWFRVRTNEPSFWSFRPYSLSPSLVRVCLMVALFISQFPIALPIRWSLEGQGLFHYTLAFTFRSESDGYQKTESLAITRYCYYCIWSCATLFTWLLYAGRDMEHLSYALGTKRGRVRDSSSWALFIKATFVIYSGD